jgi:hypothetical protein
MRDANRTHGAGIRPIPRHPPVVGLPFPLILTDHNNESSGQRTLPVITIEEAIWSTVFALS